MSPPAVKVSRDFVCDERTKVVGVKPWSEAQAKAAILRYLKDKPSAYVSEIMEDLGMGPDLAFRAVDALLAEGTVGRAP